jgi:hypothetical protein
MSKFTDVKWKRVKDLRFYFDESIEFELKKMPAESQKRFRRMAHIVSQRFAARLIELDLKLPSFDHIFVYLSTALQPGTFRYITNVDDWSQDIHLGVSPAVIFQSPTSSFDIEFVKLLYACLIEFSRVYGLDSQKIDTAYNDLIRCGEKLEITHKSYRAKGLEATVSYTVGEITEVYLTWRLLKVARQGRLKVLSIRESRDVPHLVSKIAYSKNVISIIPNNSAYSQLLIQNYYAELEFPIEVDTGLKTEKGGQQKS